MPRLRGLERAWMKTCECEMTGVCVNVCVSVRVSVPLSVVGPGPLVGEDYSVLTFRTSVVFAIRLRNPSAPTSSPRRAPTTRASSQ